MGSSKGPSQPMPALFADRATNPTNEPSAGAHVIRHARYSTVRLAESYLTRPLFRQIVARIEADSRARGHIRGPAFLERETQ